MTGVVLQPSFIPWRGYFHQIYRADVFVFYDDVQYDKHGWRNRNRIKTSSGVQWLTIPVKSQGCVVDNTPINAIEIANDHKWAVKQWRTLEQAYARRTPHFARYAPLLQQWYEARPRLLADAVIDLTVALSAELGITQTRFVRSSALGVSGDRMDRLIGVLEAIGVDHYLSGPSAKDYLDSARFQQAGITLEYMTYNYPEYPQLYPPFDPRISILDLLFMQGPDAPRFIWG